MAAYLKGRGIASFGKRFLGQITCASSRYSSISPSLLLRRAVHVSVYDKNPEELVESTEPVKPSVLPDDVIQPGSENYWAPHPQTGVFGPPEEQNLATGGERGFLTSAESVTEDSVLEQKAFFRPLEDLEKPPPQP